MEGPQYSANELWLHWQNLPSLPDGHIIPNFRKPPWLEICVELNWQFHDFDDRRFPKKWFERCGVYRLIGLEEDGNLKKPAIFNRLRGQDHSGTLYIGETGWLNERLNKLLRGEHNAIQMLRRIPILDFPPKRLAIALLFTSTSTKSIEQDMLESYMQTFGDTPPLNYRV